MERRSVTVMAALLVALVLTGCGGGGGGSAKTTGHKRASPAITIGTKNFPEQFILGELYSQALRAHGFPVNLKSDIGSSEIVDRALTAGSLDMYPEYTGVVLSEIARRHERPMSAAAAYGQAKAFEEGRGFTLLAMTPFSDSNALAVKPGFAQDNGLRTIADLAKVPGGVDIAAPPEFRTRFEGLVGLRQLYGLRSVRVRALKIGDQYAALDSGKVAVANVFTTDGQLEKSRYVLLRDPRNLFAFQNVAPVIRKVLVTGNPKLTTVIDSVSHKLTTGAMRSMNAAVAQRHQDPATVAGRFLRQSGLLK